MNRILIALLLAFVASGVHAADGEQDAAPATGCPKAQETPTKATPADANGSTGGPGTTAPVRPRSESRTRGGPRWHSLLPGMIR
ncbi:hypothetical protein [Arenimonas composti]|uniref:ESPR domain-containing protein n=1 Tax=Arenimonas composti TR7-09 = DSM 18010 TaxID=1121013 RepID=A0A091BC48_9GAMM|nr:hypothetical protein [Arenimonas composti]KFN50253.1 hypothetical protein P873_07805 [Arenimonas composti TR7-09 = DSM 18010]